MTDNKHSNGFDHYPSCAYSPEQGYQIIEGLNEIRNTLKDEFLPVIRIAAKGNTLAIKALVTLTGGLFFLLIMLIAFVTKEGLSLSHQGTTITQHGSNLDTTSAVNVSPR